MLGNGECYNCCCKDVVRNNSRHEKEGKLSKVRRILLHSSSSENDQDVKECCFLPKSRPIERSAAVRREERNEENKRSPSSSEIDFSCRCSLARDSKSCSKGSKSEDCFDEKQQRKRERSFEERLDGGADNADSIHEPPTNCNECYKDRFLNSSHPYWKERRNRHTSPTGTNCCCPQSTVPPIQPAIVLKNRPKSRVNGASMPREGRAKKENSRGANIRAKGLARVKGKMSEVVNSHEKCLWSCWPEYESRDVSRRADCNYNASPRPRLATVRSYARGYRRNPERARRREQKVQVPNQLTNPNFCPLSNNVSGRSKDVRYAQVKRMYNPRKTPARDCEGDSQATEEPSCCCVKPLTMDSRKHLEASHGNSTNVTSKRIKDVKEPWTEEEDLNCSCRSASSDKARDSVGPSLRKWPTNTMNLRVAKPDESAGDTCLRKIEIYPPTGQDGPPLTLAKNFSNINCRVKGDAKSGFRYSVTYVQKFISPLWEACDSDSEGKRK